MFSLNTPSRTKGILPWVYYLLPSVFPIFPFPCNMQGNICRRCWVIPRSIQINAVQAWGADFSSPEMGFDCMPFFQFLFYTNNVKINGCGQHMHLERWDCDFGWGVGKEGKLNFRLDRRARPASFGILRVALTTHAASFISQYIILLSQ